MTQVLLLNDPAPQKLPLALLAAHVMNAADKNKDYLGEANARIVDERHFATMRVMLAVVGQPEERWLLIFGTDEWRDWFVHNFRFLPEDSNGKMLGLVQIAKLLAEHLAKGVLKQGPGNAYWHRGFLDGWDLVSQYADLNKPACIVGHSLGAAVMQVGCFIRGVPGIGFGAPRPNFILGPAIDEHVINYCRTDDPVGDLPPRYWGYEHVGYVQWLEPAVKKPGIRHYMATSYVPIMDALAWATQRPVYQSLLGAKPPLGHAGEEA
jgi:hypothetical protein